jgi:hypothetical protein
MTAPQKAPAQPENPNPKPDQRISPLNIAGRTEGAEPADAMRRAAAEPPAVGSTRSVGTASNLDVLPALTWRRATLVLPALIAGWAVSRVHGHPDEAFLEVAAPLLVMLWTVMIGLVMLRAYEAPRDRRWASLDVLTGNGRSTMWASACAIVGSSLTGWASLSVLGVLGFAATFGTIIWTVFACGPRCWRDAKIARTLAPTTATEGDPVREELRITGLVVPPGTRWFATGRITPHGAATRYAVTSSSSRATISFESELGTMARGVYHAPPLAMWFGDVLGLARTPIVHHGEAELTVLPRPVSVDGVRDLLGRGGDAALAVQTTRMPTEGTFRIREYTPGDDTRRIHWVRSLQAGELVVRLPDEIPPAEPAIQLILDNHLWGTEWLTCRAPHDLLDAMVRVWLGVGKALADTGTRVSLLTAVDLGRGVMRAERPMLPRNSSDALRLGARVAWQANVPLATLLATRGGSRNPAGAVKQIVVATRPPTAATAGEVSWIVLPEGAWTTGEQAMPPAPLALLPHPIGSADNRFERRRAERRRIATMWADRSTFSELTSWLGVSRHGAFVALKTAKGVAIKEMS